MKLCFALGAEGGQVIIQRSEELVLFYLGLYSRVGMFHELDLSWYVVGRARNNSILTGNTWIRSHEQSGL